MSTKATKFEENKIRERVEQLERLVLRLQKNLYLAESVLHEYACWHIESEKGLDQETLRQIYQARFYFEEKIDK